MILVKQAYKLGKDYFFSKENRLKAWSLLIASIILQLTMVYSAVLMNKWNNDFYTALQNVDKSALIKSLKVFCLVVAFTIFVFIGKYICQASLALDWRKFMTEKYYNKWLENNAFFGFHLLNNNNDNPDQRISEDVRSFTLLSIELTFGILDAVVTLLSFVTILWGLSSAINFSFLNIDIKIPGYLVWSSLIYSIFGTIITYIIGRKLAGIDFLQEQKEANFRFAMMRVRENSEAISLLKGESFEKNIFKVALEEVILNNLKIININKNLGIWMNLYNNFSNIFPILLASPMYFAKKIMLGGLMQIASAFGKVQDSLSFLVDSFKTIASYKAVVDRLSGFIDNINKWNEFYLNTEIKVDSYAQDNLVIDELSLTTPSNKKLFDHLNLSFVPGKSYLITARNGFGKSTLIKAIARIWVFGKGRVLMPENKSLFIVPQAPYMCRGSLLQNITYPMDGAADLEYIKSLMLKLNINDLIERLNNIENWSTSLSTGEQQKITILRAIIYKPELLILDEATSALTEDDESKAYSLLKDKLPNAIIISIGHRKTLKAYHDELLSL